MDFDLATVELVASILASVVGSLGVIISLIFVVREIRLNTKAVRGSAYQSVINTWAEIESRISQDKEVARIYRQGRADMSQLDENEQIRFGEVLSSFFNLYEGMYYQYRDGILLQEHWKGWCENMQQDLKHPGVREWWEEKQRLYGDSFRNHVNQGRC